VHKDSTLSKRKSISANCVIKFGFWSIPIFPLKALGKRIRLVIKSVNIEYSGSRSKDFRLADKAVGDTSQNPRPTGTT